VPGACVVLDSMPLTPNGKIHRQALPEPGHGDHLHVDEPPSGPMEQAIAALWCQLLGLPAMGRHDDFFALGGHSLLAVRLCLSASTQFEVEIGISELLTHPKLAAFSNRIIDMQLATFDPAELAELAESLLESGDAFEQTPTPVDPPR
jgi:hypothetical protein